ncbi:MAG: hypothetical protein WC670_12225 [Pseudolabrys sp.]|jgi:hypothetical protein
MWINLFTVALGIALGCGATALIVQNNDWLAQETKRRRYASRRLSRVRG